MGKSIITLFSKKLDIRSKCSSKHIRKLKALLGLAVARIAILKNRHQTRRSLAHSDIAQLLTLAQFDRAVCRAEIVVREEELLDVFAIVQSYCHLITERSLLLCREMNETQKYENPTVAFLVIVILHGSLSQLRSSSQSHPGPSTPEKKLAPNYEAFWKELDGVKQIWKNRKQIWKKRKELK